MQTEHINRDKQVIALLRARQLSGRTPIVWGLLALTALWFAISLVLQIATHRFSSLWDILIPSPTWAQTAIQVALYCKAHGIDAVIDCCEIVTKYQERLQAQGFPVMADDFLKYRPTELYDVILMNPPFSGEGDALSYIAHIMHAFDLLVDGGFR